MHIAILDDGISVQQYRIGNLKYDIEVIDGHIVEKRNKENHPNSHGSVCAAIIQKYVKHSTLSSVKILNEESWQGKVSDLCCGIEWCIENQVNIIHLSIGTVRILDFSSVRESCYKAYQKGIVIIAAQSNKGEFTMPAGLSFVIGVRSRNLYQEAQFALNLNRMFDGIDFLASSIHSIECRNGEVIKTPPCNSFAAPLITAMAANILEERKLSLQLLVQALIDKSVSPNTNKTICNQMIDCRYSERYIVVSSMLDQVEITDKMIRGYKSCKDACAEEGQLNDYLFIEEKIDNHYIQEYEILIREHHKSIRSCLLFISKNTQLVNILNRYNVMYWLGEKEEVLTSIEQDMNTDVEIPVVLFKGDIIHTVKHMQEIVEMFAKDRYCVYAITDNKYGELFGVQYVGMGRIKAAISLVAGNKQVDMIFCITNTIEQLWSDDLVLEVSKSSTAKELYSKVLDYYS